MADDLISALRGLANRWAVRARDFNRDAKTETDTTKAAYNRGFAEGYYRAATELATLLKEGADRLPLPSTPPTAARPQTAAAPPAPAQPAVNYVAMPVSEALLTLSYAGSEPRDIEARKDNTFRAIFSRWENLTDHERVEKLKRTDSRIVVISSGRSKDTHDPYIEFAYKSS